jgi:glutamyl-tRNA reductase
MLCIDLAIPRDIHEDVKELPHIELYYLDDLHSHLQVGQHLRQDAAQEAKKLIQSYLTDFATLQAEQKHGALIFQYRAQAEQLRQQALEQALQQLNKGIPAKDVCDELSKQLTSRLLHHPTLGLRDMIARSDEKTLACLAARLEKEA